MFRPAARAVRHASRVSSGSFAFGTTIGAPQSLCSALRGHHCCQPVPSIPNLHRSYAVRFSDAVTPIEKILLDTIKATGPISFGTYMQMCLSHPIEGYYMKADRPVFGERGDFTTSPEISQVFGEVRREPRQMKSALDNDEECMR